MNFRADSIKFATLRGQIMPGSPVTLSVPNAKIEIWILRAFLKGWPPIKVQNGIFQTDASD